MSCPNCSGENWKLASLVYKQGLSDVDMSASGSTIGVGAGSSGIGGGYAKTTSNSAGTHRTKFSQSAEPPCILAAPPTEETYTQQKKNANVGRWVMLAILLLAFYLTGKLLFAIPFFLFMGIFSEKIDAFLDVRFEKDYAKYVIDHAKLTEDYKESLAAYKKWELTKICMRCGTFYT